MSWQDEPRWVKRREQMQERPLAEVREIADAECVVPLDFQMAEIAREEIRRRETA